MNYNKILIGLGVVEILTVISGFPTTGKKIFIVLIALIIMIIGYLNHKKSRNAEKSIS